MTDTPKKACLFCPVRENEIIATHPLAVAVRDNFPLTPGHTLVVPLRHVASFFDTTVEERIAMMELLDRARAIIDKEHGPDGYNVGINNGPAAGQTVMHMHMHLIPRYLGDTSDPRGGVRWIFPDRAAYWKKKLDDA